MQIEKQIIEKISKQFSPLVLNLENESHKHRSSLNGESHFKLTIVSTQFEQMKTVERHRSVYCCLEEELSTTVHALALHLYSQSEWEDNQGAVPRSPSCITS